MAEVTFAVGFAPDFGEQSFDDPWQATLFALTVRTSQAGHFTWTEWVERFSAGLARHGEALTLDRYFQTWIDTFCDLVDGKLAIDDASIRATMEDWRRSYLATPHGQPIVLRRDLPATLVDACADADHDHHHHHNHHHHHHHLDIADLPPPVHVDPALETTGADA